MHQIRITTENELIKLFARKKIKIILFLEAILCVLVAILGASGTSLKVSNFSISLPNLPFTMLPVFTSFLIPLTIFMLVSDIFSYEFESNTIKTVLLRPVSRFKIFVSKNLAITLFVLLNLIFSLVVTVLLRFIFKGTLEKTENAVIAYLISVVPMIIFILMASFIAQLINNPTLMMFSCIILYIVLTALKIVFTGISAALFVSYTGWYQMWIGSLVPAKLLISTLLMLLSYIVIFFIAGFLVFDSKEL